jgi:predicted RNA-binding Zn-ribbon protein involved in translation (DUF1610 family)
MTFLAREEPFTCGHCNAAVEPLGRGTYRNHCPQCLWSKHVDDVGPGDRASLCKGMMEPAGFDMRKGQWVVRHQCTACGKEIVNTLAPDDQWETLLPKG